MPDHRGPILLGHGVMLMCVRACATWQVDCNYVVSSSHPVFARLEHHRSHEYTSRRSPGYGGSKKGRRGRPPKTAADYEFSEDEIRARAAVDGPSSAIAHGFVRYTAVDQCPDRRCAHRQREHFHCVRARCHDVELQPAALVAHATDFHANVRIAAGFEFFGADVDCRRTRCRARRGVSGPTGLRHFHCVRAGCDYAFVRQSTMAQHEAKHRASDEQRLMMMSKSSQSSSSSSLSRQPVAIAPRPTTAAVSVLPSPAAGVPTVHGVALLPASLSTSLTGGPPRLVSTTFAAAASTFMTTGEPLPTAAAAVPLATSASHDGMIAVTVSGAAAAVPGLVSTSVLSPSVIVVDGEAGTDLCRSTLPSTVPLHGAKRATMVSPPPRADEVSRLQWRRDDCGRPFCRLKPHDHFHCSKCDDAFFELPRLSEHLSSVHGIAAAAAASLPAVHEPVTLEQTSVSSNTSPQSYRPPSTSSNSTLSGPVSVCWQSAPANSETSGLQDSLDISADRNDNDNDDDNSDELVIDLSSSCKSQIVAAER